MRVAVIERLLCLLDVHVHALALCEVSRGSRLSLPGMDEVLVHYVIAGGGVLRDEQGVTIPFRPDSLIFLPSRCGHELAERGDEPELVQWKDVAKPIGDGLMAFAGSANPVITSACGTITADCEGVDPFAQLREPVVEDLSGEPAIRAAFMSISEEFRSPRFGTKSLAEALMKQCIILALRNQVERGETTLLPIVGYRDPRLIRALLELMEDPARDHTLEGLASASGMSRALFAERFTEAFDRPPMDLLKQIRLHRAAKLLRSTNLPIQVIALTVGYASRSYFSRAFKTAYGRDPKAFREQARAASTPLASRPTEGETP